MTIHYWEVSCSLWIGTELSDLEWPWTAWWPLTHALSLR